MQQVGEQFWIGIALGRCKEGPGVDDRDLWVALDGCLVDGINLLDLIGRSFLAG